MPKQRNQFTLRLIRDLVWVISSPPLVSGLINDTHWWSHKECLNEFNDCLPTLINLDKNPQALINYLDKLATARLGLKFEALVAYWLTISPNYQLLSKNLQIIEEDLTLGEIDFIIQEVKSQKIIHLEVAVKFYLGCPPYTNPYRWFGTNTKDQFGKKIDHLKNHQTQLSKKYPHHFKHQIDEQHCLIKGRLFYPSDFSTAPKGMNVTANHLRGSWSYAKDNQQTTKIIPLDKNNWLAEFNHEDIKREIKQKNLLTRLESAQIDRAQCYLMVEKIENKYQEKERMFYLPKAFTFPSDSP